MKKIISFFLIICMAFELAACGKSDIPELIEPVSLTPAYFAVQKGTIYSAKYNSASVSPVSYPVYFQVSGNYKNCGFKLGDMVKKGDIIIKNSEDYESREKELIKNIEEYSTISDYYVKKHASELKEMKSGLSGLSGFEKKSLEIDIREKQTRDAYDEAERANTLSSMQIELNELQSKKDSYVYEAPCDGRLAYISVIDESYVNCDDDAADAPAFIIADENDSYVGFQFQNKSEFESYDKVKLLVGEEEYNDFEYLAYTDEEIDTATRYRHTLVTRLKVKNPGETFKLGAFAAVIEYPIYLEDVLYVPNICVNSDRDKGVDYVYIKSEDGKEDIRTVVQCGAVCDNFTEIISGLSEGQLVSCGYDNASYGISYEYVKASPSNYYYEAYFDEALKVGYSQNDISAPVSGTIGNVLIQNYSNVYVTADTPLFSIIPEISKLDLETLRIEYENQQKSHDSAIKNYDENIAAHEKTIKESKDMVEKTIAEYELEGLKEDREDFVAQQDEALLAIKTKYENYVKWEEEGECIVYAGYDGTFYNRIPFVTDNSIKEGTVIGYVQDLDSFVLNITDTMAGVFEAGTIRYGSQIKLRSEGGLYDFVAYSTRDLSYETYDSFLSHAIATTDDSATYSRVNNNTASVNYPAVDIKNVITVPADAVYKDENTKETYILVKQGDFLIKRYVKTAYAIGDRYWIYSGLELGEEYAVAK